MVDGLSQIAIEKLNKKVFSIKILIEVEVEIKVVKPHFEVNMEVHMVDIINMKVNLMEVDEETLKEKEVAKVVVEVIEVNNQIAFQTYITTGNLGTW